MQWRQHRCHILYYFNLKQQIFARFARFSLISHNINQFKLQNHIDLSTISAQKAQSWNISPPPPFAPRKSSAGAGAATETEYVQSPANTVGIWGPNTPHYKSSSDASVYDLW